MKRKIEGRRIDNGEDYRDEYVIEQLTEEPMLELVEREEIWRGYKGDVYGLYYAVNRLVEREETLEDPRND